MPDDFSDPRFRTLLLDALSAQGDHLAALDGKLDRSNTLLEHVIDQLRHMNEAIIRTLTVRTELDELRARLARLEAR